MTPFYQSLLNLFPLPNGPIQSDGLALFSANYSNPAVLDATSIRVDHTVSSHFTLFGRYNYSPSVLDARQPKEPSQRGIEFVHTHTLTIGATQTFHQSYANDIRFNYSRNGASNRTFEDNFGGAIPTSLSGLIPPPVPNPGSFGLGILALGLGLSNGQNAGNFQRQINLVDTLSMTTGNHQIKVGADLRRLNPSLNPFSYQITFQPVIADITKSTMTTLVLQTVRGSNLLFHNLSLFGQDNWRVTSRLTVTYGLRWELNPPPTFPGKSDPIIALNDLAQLLSEKDHAR